MEVEWCERVKFVVGEGGCVRLGGGDKAVVSAVGGNGDGEGQDVARVFVISMGGV